MFLGVDCPGEACKKEHNWIIKLWFIFLRAFAALRQIYATFKAANQQIHRNSSSDTNVDFNNEEINTDLANAFPQGEKNLKVRMHLLV